jgi:septal ring factor EnvC (AmiA/AmiB activator)
MQISLESETKGKSEAIRLRKKLEQDINELEMALDASNRGKQELEKSVKRYSTQMQDLQRMIDDAQRDMGDSRESYVMNERRCNVLISEVDEE